MRHRLLTYILLFAFSAFLNACKGEPPAKVETPKETKPEVKAEEVPKPADEPQVQLGPKERNPFMSYLAKKIEVVAEEKTPLECCELESFKLLAVMRGEKERAALIQFSDGRKTIVKIGERIGLRGGKIVNIVDGRIIVEEVERDEEGNVVSRPRVELALPKGKGEEKGKPQN